MITHLLLKIIILLLANSLGVMMNVENIRKNQLSNYSYLFTTTNNLSEQIFVKKGGNYLCGYHHGSYDGLRDSYQKNPRLCRAS